MGVTVAGLLNHRNIRAQFSPQKSDYIFLPLEMYNSEGRDLLGEPMEELARYYNSQIILS